MSMTKTEIIATVYDQLDLRKKDCVSLVDSLFEIIKDDLANGRDVMISGFGKWSVKAKKKRNGRNPQTGEPMPIAARRIVTFNASHVLRGAVNSED